MNILSPHGAKVIAEKSLKDPKWWVENVLGDSLWEKQVQILESLRDNQETAVASCHGAGKSFTASRALLWFLYTHRPSVVITTAPTDRQVRGILWKEIRLAHQRAKFPLGGKMLTQELKLDSNWWAWGFTAPEHDPDRFQGFHEVNILVIVDEACGVSEQIFEAIDGILTTENARLLMIGNPTESSGRFGKAFKSSKVKKFHISAYDTPNFTELGITESDMLDGSWEQKMQGKEVPRPYLVTPFWIYNRALPWGVDSQIYKSRVLGEFPEGGDDTLIPLSWVERALSRDPDFSGEKALGVDVARYGSDETVFVKREGNHARIHQVIAGADTMAVTGQIVMAHRATQAEFLRVDADGVGAGVADRLKEQGKPVVEMRSGFKASDSERFANKRAEWWWSLRERFEKDNITINEDDELIFQLTNIKYKINSRGQILIESKDEMKHRGLKSPDRADALMLAFADEYPPKKTVLRARSSR